MGTIIFKRMLYDLSREKVYFLSSFVSVHVCLYYSFKKLWEAGNKKRKKTYKKYYVKMSLMIFG